MTVDLTGIAVSAIGAIFGVVGPVFLIWLQSHMKDKQAADLIGLAVTNAVGAAEQAAVTGVRNLSPEVNIPGISTHEAVALSYVLNHAGDAADRLGLTQSAIADKIAAKMGLQALAVKAAAVPAIAAILARPANTP
jgi:hypothetical protein